MKKKVSVLLIEDSDEDAKLIMGFLGAIQDISISIRRVVTLKEAIHWLESCSPKMDLILLDLNLPDSKGLATFTALSETTNTLPVVIVSAQEDHRFSISAMELGAQDYLDKSKLDAYLMQKSISHAIERHALMQKLIHNIEEEKKAKNALNHVKSVLENAHKLARLSSWEYDFSTEKLRVSNEFMALLHIQPEELLRYPGNRRNEISISTLLSRVHPEDRDSVEKLFNVNSHHPLAFSLQYRLLVDSDETIFVKSLGSYLENKEKILFRVVGVNLDITDLQQAKEALEEAQKIAKMGSWELDTESRKMNLSREMSNIFHFGGREQVFYDELLEKIHPDDRDRVDQTYWQSVEKVEPFFIVHRIEADKDSDAIEYIEAHGQQKTGPDGKAIRTVGTVQDITEKVALEETLRRKEEMMLVQSRQAAMGDMIAMIAHQWRQPITVIAMAANNLKADMMLGEKISEDLLEKLSDDILLQTEYLSRTIDDFRDFFKPNRELQPVKICDVLDRVLAMIGKSFENNNIAVEVDGDCPQVAEIKTYPNELMQVFLNILNNAKDAIKSSRPGKAQIQIDLRQIDGYVRVSITDNGGGIAEDVYPRLGEPYVSTKVRSGTGLGIYMSKVIIENHLNGFLEWFNTESGACFVINIPADLTENNAKEKSKEF